MKYWYLKGGDVLGPLNPKEIVQDSDFAMDALVCPEPNSDDESYWKTPQDYMDDFGPALRGEDTTAPADTAETPATEQAPLQQEPPLKEASSEDDDVETVDLDQMYPDENFEDTFTGQELKKSTVSGEETIDEDDIPTVEDPVLTEAQEIFKEKEQEPQEDFLSQENPQEEQIKKAESLIEQVSPEETIHGQSPLTAPLQDNLLDEIPAEAPLASQPAQPAQPDTLEALQEPTEEIVSEEEKLIAAVDSLAQDDPPAIFNEDDFNLDKKEVPPVEEKEEQPQPEAQPQKQLAPGEAKPSSVISQEQTQNTLQTANKTGPKIEKEEYYDDNADTLPILQKNPKPVTDQKEEEDDDDVFIKTPPPSQNNKEEENEPSLISKIEASDKQEQAKNNAEEDDDLAPAETFTTSNAVVLKSNEGEPVEPARSANGKDFFNDMDEAAPAAAEEGAEAFPFNHEDPFSEETKRDKTPKNTVTPDHSAAATQKSNSLISAPGQLMATNPTTNGKIISSINVEEQNSKPKNDIIYILVFVMFLVLGVAIFMFFFYNKEAQPQPEQQNNPAPIAQQEQPRAAVPVPQGLDEGVPAYPTFNTQQEAMPPAQDTPQAIAANLIQQDGATVQNQAEANLALNLVKNYKLSKNRGTVEQYFNKSYSDYQTKWEANPLSGNIYIVKFFASQIRKEPIVYLFTVDVKNRTITGGLNNVTINLLSN